MSWIFHLALMAAATLYATVGHGGASSYLAIFALSGEVSPQEMRASALVLNLIVSAVSFIGYRSRNHFDLKTLGLLIITSIPAAFLGGLVQLPGNIYQIILGIFLLIAALKITGIFGKNKTRSNKINVSGGLVTGAILGFISGVIGIGGGIILSPLLLFFGWAPIKTTAGVSAAFIFINSAAGLTGIFASNQLNLHPDLPWWALFVFAGGIVGSITGSRYLSGRQVQWALAAVLFTASVKLLLL